MMVWMGFTSILYTNIILDGRCWDFKLELSLNVTLDPRQRFDRN